MGIARPRRPLALAVLLLALLCALAGWQMVRAAGQAQDGKLALLAASDSLSARDLPVTEHHLRTAQQSFDGVEKSLRLAGPVVWVARYVPVSRVQFRAVDAITDAGQAVSTAGLELLPTVNALTVERGGVDTASIVRSLASSRQPVQDAVASLEDADRRLRALDAQRLFGPLERARAELRPKLADAVVDAQRAQAGLAVLTEITGADADRRHLLLSQNPEEPRPTGGYMGTYGVLEGREGRAELTRYAATGDWYTTHPGVQIPPEASDYPFRFSDPPVTQSLGDVNTTPDWPSAGRRAVQLWNQSGEPPVDGVLTFRPDLLSRLLDVLGPVQVPGYPTAFTADNLAGQLDFYTHGAGIRGTTLAERKQPVGDLAQVVLRRTVEAPGDQLVELATAFANGLDADEAAVYSARPEVQALLDAPGWDGAFEGADGDFFADAEFAYSSKNGSLLRRTFRHSVRLAEDGSGTTATVLTVQNTGAYDFLYNKDSNAYLTPYGPRGAALVVGLDEVVNTEPPLDGHPTAGFLLAAPPEGSASLTLGWQSPALLLSRTDGNFEYRLTWRPTPGHRGDLLELDVELPPGWRWQDQAPPAQVALDGPFTGRWVVTPD